MIRRRRSGLVALVLALAVGLGGVGLFVLPQRERANVIDAEIVTARARVAVAGDFAKTYRPEALDSADLFRLAKAMPSSVGMPDLLLQLERSAASSGVTLDAVSPRAAVQRRGYRAVPIDLTAQGSFYAVSDFLLRLRSAVRVRGTSLDVTGRLFAVDRLTLTQPVRGQDLSVTLTVSAFAFDGAAVPATPAAGRAR
jgi:hypothetical protein